MQKRATTIGGEYREFMSGAVAVAVNVTDDTSSTCDGVSS